MSFFKQWSCAPLLLLRHLNNNNNNFISFFVQPAKNSEAYSDCDLIKDTKNCGRITIETETFSKVFVSILTNTNIVLTNYF